MNKITEELLRIIGESLFELSFSCKDCSKSLECEDQWPQGPRYCWFMIQAAIMEQDSFEIPK